MSDEARSAFMTTREVAALLRVRERKIYEMAAADEIPSRRVVGKLLFPRAAIERWLGVEDAAGAAAVPAVVAGSHDPLLEWAIRESGSGLATFFDGSGDGLSRVASGAAAAAGLHLYEPESGDWNLAAAAAALGAADAALIRWATRARGLLVAPGAADAVRGLADLKGRAVAMRQPGSGGASVMRHLLAEAGLSEADFAPVAAPARTETEAAAAVASGEAEAATGLEASARQFGLAFVPLIEERYDLAIRRRAWFEPELQRLFAFARGPRLAEKAATLGGYDVAGLGEVRWNGP